MLGLSGVCVFLAFPNWTNLFPYFILTTNVAEKAVLSMVRLNRNMKLKHKFKKILLLFCLSLLIELIVTIFESLVLHA